MNLRRIPIRRLNPAPYNPRVEFKPGSPEYESLKMSLERFGMLEPVIWNKRSGNVVSGHRRLKILAARGDLEVDVVEVDLNDLDEKALNITMNKGGEFDLPKLKEILVELDSANVEIKVTGFDLPKLEKLVAWPGPGGICPACGSPKIEAPKRQKPQNVSQNEVGADRSDAY